VLKKCKVLFILSIVTFYSCTTHKKNMNDKYLNNKTDINSWITKFENNEREVYKFRKLIVDELEIKKNESIADIGAGTGFFLDLIHANMSGDSDLYGVDISEKFVKYMNERVNKNKLSRAKIILGNLNSTTLKNETVNKMILVDTFHHFDNPRLMLEDIRNVLRPGGTLYIIDFDKSSKNLSSWLRKHITSSKEDYINQLKENHFEFIKEHKIGLSENFMLSFRVKKGVL